MAKKIENEKGFLVLEIERAELIKIIGKYGSLGICDSCGETARKGYYVAVLNMWICENCYKAFINNTKRYKEDEAIEKRNFERYCKIFDVEL